MDSSFSYYLSPFGSGFLVLADKSVTTDIILFVLGTLLFFLFRSIVLNFLLNLSSLLGAAVFSLSVSLPPPALSSFLSFSRPLTLGEEGRCLLYLPLYLQDLDQWPGETTQ